MESSTDMHAEETTCNKTSQSSVISIYRAKIGGVYRNVTVTWSKNLMNHTLCVSIEKTNNDSSTITCKVDLKPWSFWSKLKGSKTLDVDSKRVDIFWNFRSAKYSDGPEPMESYFVALACDAVVVLLLGDLKKKAYRKTKSRPSLEDAMLLTKKENVFGKKCFATRIKFDDKKDHDIVVVNSISGHKDPEMWISIDGTVLMHVNNLQWKFRGNDTLWVEEVPLQVFWDVHDWLFRAPGVGYALFIFKPGMPATTAEDYYDDEATSSDHIDNESSLARSSSGEPPEFCFYLYAWKLDSSSVSIK